MFMCIGLYHEGKRIGFFDVPLVWAEGRDLLTSRDIQSPGFLAMMNAMKVRHQTRQSEGETIYPPSPTSP